MNSFGFETWMAAFALVVALSGCEYFEKVMPADPEILSRDMVTSPNPTDYTVRVIAEVRNNGEAGEVEVEATVKQGGQEWTRKLVQRLEKGEKKRFEIVFDEVELGKGAPGYEVSARPKIM